MLKGQDIVVLLALLTSDERSARGLAEHLDWAPTGVHRSLQRLATSRLYDPLSKRVSRARATEFLVHGVPYVFPAQLGAPVRGIPTAWAAEPLVSLLAPSDELPPVRPNPFGEVRGQAFEPLHEIARAGELDNRQLKELLALVDAIRGGDARIRNLATALLTERLDAA